MNMQWVLEIGDIEGETIPNPSWKRIHSKVLEMDGSSFDELAITLVGKGTLEIAGGDERRYLVVYFPENHPDTPSLTLTDLSLTGPAVELVVQQQAKYPAKYAVQMPLALKVAEYFFHTGELPKDVRWELDNTGIEAEL